MRGHSAGRGSVGTAFGVSSGSTPLTHAGLGALIPACCALVLAGCGSSGKSSTLSGSGAYRASLKFSQCMRANGVPNFPDPSAGGGGIQFGGPPGPGSDLNPRSPAFRAARETCTKDLPGGGPSRVVPENVKLNMLRHAECMRAHGVADYPDPIFPPGGGIESFIPSSAQLDSPAFKTAAKACGGP